MDIQADRSQFVAVDRRAVMEITAYENISRWSKKLAKYVDSFNKEPSS
jgi:hypothetical protein